MFRGREMAHPERGEMILNRLAEDLGELAVVEQRPQQDGRNMTMMLAPRVWRRSRRGRDNARRGAATAPGDGAGNAARGAQTSRGRDDWAAALYRHSPSPCRR